MGEISAHADDRTRVLKQGDSLAVLDRGGSIRPGGLGEMGLFHEGVRFLGRFEVALDGQPLVLLSSTVRRDNTLVVDFANADFTRNPLHVFAKSFLWRGAYYASFRLHNYSGSEADFELSLRFAKDGRARLAFAPASSEQTESEALFRLRLPPRGEQTLEVTVSLEGGRDEPAVPGFCQALEEMESALQAKPAGARIGTSNASFNAWLERSESDVRMMLAGDRDGLLAGYETLWIDPLIALDTLSGQILNDDRGAADTMPLFVLLAGACWRRTADRAFLESVWPRVEKALAWIDDHGDRDGDGFVEGSSSGWKPTDAVFHRDGTNAEGPVAFCEVQGYVYAARRAGADLARALDRGEEAERLEAQAEELRERFERSFWCEEISTYCMALDGEKRRCDVRSSNAGQCLFTGIVSRPRAWRVTHTLLNESSFSGWGIRTLDSGEARYNPMSRHNGSVWPHDNALIALGMARYGRKDGAVKLLSGLLEASQHFDLQRMPELFCGFRQRSQEGPTPYPRACAPHFPAAGAVFLLLQACLGLDIDAPARRLRFEKPELPASLNELTITNLAIGDATVDLTLQRHEKDVEVHLERRDGEVEVVVVK